MGWKKYDPKKDITVCSTVDCDNPSSDSFAWGRNRHRIYLCNQHAKEHRKRISIRNKEAKYGKRPDNSKRVDIKPIVNIASLCQANAASDRFIKLCNQYIRENF